MQSIKAGYNGYISYKNWEFVKICSIEDVRCKRDVPPRTEQVACVGRVNYHSSTVN